MNLEYIKLLEINIKDYLNDLTVFILIAPIPHYILQVIYFKYLHPFALEKKIDLFPLSLDIVLFLSWIILFIIIRSFWHDYFKTKLAQWHSDKYEFELKKNKLTQERFLREWIFQGNSQPHKGGLLVTNSNSGALIKPQKFLGLFNTKKIWKNFVANINLEFPLLQKEISVFEDYVGFIFRAQNLDDYFMLEIVKRNGFIELKPHTRIGGNWDAPIYAVESNILPANEQIVEMNIEVKESVLTIYIGEKSAIWLLPTHVDKNLIQQTGGKDNITKTLIPSVYFRNRAGMIGFRCYGNQVAFIKSLNIFSI